MNRRGIAAFGAVLLMLAATTHAIDTGVAQRPIADMAAYRQTLRARLNPTASILSLAFEAARANPKRVLFAEGEEENVLRAAIAFKDGGYGTPVLVGREDVYDKLAELGVDDPMSYEVLNSRNSPLVGRAVDFIYEKHQRHGMLRRAIERMVNQDRNTFAAAMLALGEGDAMITGSSERERIHRQSSSPSVPGSMTSSTTRSGDSRSTSSRASSPSSASSVAYPSRSR